MIGMQLDGSSKVVDDPSVVFVVPVDDSLRGHIMHLHVGLLDLEEEGSSLIEIYPESLIHLEANTHSCG